MYYLLVVVSLVVRITAVSGHERLLSEMIYSFPRHRLGSTAHWAENDYGLSAGQHAVMLSSPKVKVGQWAVALTCSVSHSSKHRKKADFYPLWN